MPTPERVSVPEGSSETSREREEGAEKRDAEHPGEPVPAPVGIQPIQALVAPKDETLVEIESTLAEGLEDVFKNLPPNLKPAFKAKGEEVALTIKSWMDEAKIVAQKVLKLIREWLGMVPNVNKYFLEQESKIKRDHIMALAKRDVDDVL